MVIKSYKKYLLSLLVLLPAGISADLGDVVCGVTKELGYGAFGWSAHAGLGYLSFKGYKAFTAESVEGTAKEVFKIAGQEIAPSNLVKISLAAHGFAALYHSAMLWRYCTFGVQLRKMKRQNTSTNLVLRNRWAECDTAAELMNQLAHYPGGREALKRQLFFNMGLEQNASPLEAIKKVDTALTQLDKRLKMYESYTNIVELTAQRMIDQDSDTRALLDGDVLITDDITLYSEDILQEYASNSWISNSPTIGLFFKEDCYFRRPWLYTATYNMASYCAMKTLEQYARLKAVRHILQQYIPANQRQSRVIVHQH